MEGLMKFLLGVVLSLFMSFSCFAENTVKQVYSSMHQIHMEREDSESYCTAYATGPHTIITAEHCIEGSKEAPIFTIDPRSNNPKLAIAGQIIKDGNDHVIIELQHLNLETSFSKFDSWIDVSKRNLTIRQGEVVYFFGAPDSIGCSNCFHFGYFSGEGILETDDPEDDWNVKDHSLLIFIVPVAPGDSGSLMFDKNGNPVGMVSSGQWGFTGSFKFGFTDEQWKEASK